MIAPKICLLDIETAPSLGYFWGKLFETSIVGVECPWYMLCYSWKWLGEKKIHTRALCDYDFYDANLENDFFLVKDLHKVFSEADIIIAHNGDRFDIRKTNARFIKYNMRPPLPYKTIDTLKAARKHFMFESNRLNDLGKYLGVGGKIAHTGFDLWKRAMSGERAAWLIMKKYNQRDVDLLEKVYERLRPFITVHPNVAIYQNRVACTACGSKHIVKRGFHYSKVRKYQQWQCRDCGHWHQDTKAVKQ